MRWTIVLLTTLLLLAACTTQAPEDSEAKKLADQLRETSEEPAQTTTEPPAEETTPEEQPEPAPEQVQEDLSVQEETTSEPQKRTRMYRFFDTFVNKVKNYRFTHKGNQYLVKGTRYKIILKSVATVKDVDFGSTHKSLFYYDAIYVDRATKQAIAYCEGHTSQVNTQCSQLELYDLPYPAPYKQYEMTLPEDWLFSHLDQEPDLVEDNKYYVYGRATTFVKFAEEDLELNFDPGTGLVLRADQKKGPQLIARYDYEDLTANDVRDADMQHRSKDEIASDEVFYKKY